jgi:hypothetical protein
MIEDNDGSHQRRNKRSLVLLAAKLKVTGGHTVDVRLRNLSQNGALLEADTPPPVGSDVVFERGETIVDARVAWQARGRFGIEFLQPIDESEVLIHVGKPAARREGAPPIFRRTGFKDVPLNEGEKKFGAEWARSNR